MKLRYFDVFMTNKTFINLHLQSIRTKVRSQSLKHINFFLTVPGNVSSSSSMYKQTERPDPQSVLVKTFYVMSMLQIHVCCIAVGEQADRGDSGGGFTIVRDNLHFVIGVISTKILDQTNYAMFTNISNAEHRNWLETHKSRLDSLHRETQHQSRMQQNKLLTLRALLA